jgi:hypothetical protein
MVLQPCTTTATRFANNGPAMRHLAAMGVQSLGAATRTAAMGRPEPLDPPAAVLSVQGGLGVRIRSSFAAPSLSRGAHVGGPGALFGHLATGAGLHLEIARNCSTTRRELLSRHAQELVFLPRPRPLHKSRPPSSSPPSPLQPPLASNCPPLAHHEVRWLVPAQPPPSTRSPTNPCPRFGQQLKQSLNKEWLFYYIDYEGLKTALRVHHTWDEKSEQNFVEQLEKELDKVYTFVRVKSDEIIRRIAASDKEVNEAVARSQRQQQHDTTQGDDAFDEDFDLLEEDLSDIIADVHDLAKFTQLNYTGFQKIIKKHDVRSPACCPRSMLTRRRKTHAGCSSPSSPPA